MTFTFTQIAELIILITICAILLGSSIMSSYFGHKKKLVRTIFKEVLTDASTVAAATAQVIDEIAGKKNTKGATKDVETVSEKETDPDGL